eukprot:gene16684-22944_t
MVSVAQLLDRASLYGQGQKVLSGHSISEECERELEKEEEEEEEVERETARVDPTLETDWAYETALYATSISMLQSAPLIPLPDMVRDMLQPKELAAPHIAWSRRVYCTKNFAYAVRLGVGPYNEYLRPVESFLLLPDGCVVLLSEREADALLELACELKLSGSKAIAQSPQMMMLCYAQAHHVSSANAQQHRVSGAGAQQHRVSGAGAQQHCVSGAGLSSPSLSLSFGHQSASLPRVSVDVLVSLGLLNGDTSYGEEQVALLRKFMIGKRDIAEELVGMRGKQSMLPRSDLDKVINDMQ